MSEKVGQTWEDELLALGEARGRLLGYRKALEMWLRQRFGELPPEVVRRLAQADLPALQRAVDAFPTLAAPEDLPL